MRVITLRNYVEPQLLRTQEQSCNCSLFNLNSKTFLISRCVTYFLCDTHGFVMNDKFHTTNFLYEVDTNFNLRKIKELNNPYKAQQQVKYNGLEDIRTINWDGSIYFLCSKVIGNSDAATMCYGKFSTDTLDLGDLNEVKTQNAREKNWAPIEIEPFNCMYSHSPATIINLHTRTKQTIGNGISGIRGSSAIVRYDDNTLVSLVHTKDSSFKYVHQLIKYNNQLQVIAVSQPFTFLGAKTEFCCTLKVTPTGILLIPSVNDGISYIFNLPSEFANKLFNHQLDNDWVDPNLYNKLFFDAISNTAYEVAATAACLSTDKTQIAASVKYNYERSPIDLLNRYRRQNALIDRFNSL